MVKQSFFILTYVLISISVFAQKEVKIELKNTDSFDQQIPSYQKETSQGLIFKESIKYINLKEVVTKEGNYLELTGENLIKSYDKGNPSLPLISKLIEIPANMEPKINIISFTEEVIDLKEYNLKKLIVPAQPSHSKSDDPNKLPFYKNGEVYNKNGFFKNEIVKVEDKGYLRNKHIAYVQVSPFHYNPTTNTLKVINDLKYEITYSSSKKGIVLNNKSLESPYFNDIVQTINSVESKAIITGPVKYVIVSDRMFETTLKPFVEWKTKKGFNVIEAYTDDSNVGNTTASIKAYLKDLYENPSDGIAPTFVLFVGDIDQIPSFDTKLSGDYHVTDLYYCEYTDDYLPEVFYGRFSATTVEQLQAQIDKTLYVEQYQISDPSYLNNVVLVAGVDATYAPNYGNGFVNYANAYYTNSENGINSYYYLYNDDSGVMSSSNSGASASIKSYINAGVSIANYTAHCNSNGWSEPSFSNSDVGLMSNSNQYPLMIGNCCQSVKFELNSFGEEVLRAENKGAVGYIGGSDFTYWDEDYYWGVGLAEISANPTYENSGLGAYDRFFHQNGEAKGDWYITQGQMVVAGNLEVEASSSSWKDYYWEIYHLMGDPSLVPYVRVPEQMVATYDLEIIENSTVMQVMSEEYSYVALSKDGVLLDAKFADETGLVNLDFNGITGTGNLDIVITKQNRQPIIDQISIVSDSKPNVCVKQIEIDDSAENDNGIIEYGEQISFNVLLENSSALYNAQNVTFSVSSSDTNIVISDGSESFGIINAEHTKLINAAVVIDFKDRFKDQQKVELNIELQWENEAKISYSKTLALNFLVSAPELKVKSFDINDHTGNDDGILDPGEIAIFKIEVQNTGNADITNVFGEIKNIVGSSKINIKNAKSEEINLAINEIKEVAFELSLDANEELKTPVTIDFGVEESLYNYYKASKSVDIVLGETPEVLVSKGGIVKIGAKGAMFYDTGGASAAYANDEDYTITFITEEEYEKLSVDFSYFNIESHGTCGFDYLTVYDSSLVHESALIGTYCGTNSPGLVEPTNIEGALTFVFHSDPGVTSPGWIADVTAQKITTSKESSIDNSKLKIYPNPTNGLLYIEGLRNYPNVKIKVFNVLGNVVYSKNVSDYTKEQINISNQAKGMYIVSIESDNGRIMSKRIIFR